jgi:hypothetical protein
MSRKKEGRTEIEEGGKYMLEMKKNYKLISRVFNSNIRRINPDR